jgi:hypothetical protein
MKAGQMAMGRFCGDDPLPEGGFPPVEVEAEGPTGRPKHRELKITTWIFPLFHPEVPRRPPG